MLRHIVLSSLFVLLSLELSAAEIYLKTVSKKRAERFISSNSTDSELALRKVNAKTKAYAIYAQKNSLNSDKLAILKKTVPYRTLKSGQIIFGEYDVDKKAHGSKVLKKFKSKGYNLKFGKIYKSYYYEVYEKVAESSEEEIETNFELVSLSFDVDQGKINSDYRQGMTSMSGSAQYLYGDNFKATLDVTYKHNWEYTNSGDANTHYFDFTGTLLEVDSELAHLSVGVPMIKWGVLDIISPEFKTNKRDLSRSVIADDDDNLGIPGARVQSYFTNSKLDLYFLDGSSSSELPNKNSLWYPIRSDSIQGVETTPSLEQLLAVGDSVERDSDSTYRYGIRYEHNFDSIDLGVSYQHVVDPTPYLQVNQNFVNAIAAGTSQMVALATYSSELFELVHNEYDQVSSNIVLSSGNFIYKGEVSYSPNSIATTTSLNTVEIDTLEYGAGIEYQHPDINYNMFIQLNAFNKFEGSYELADRINSYLTTINMQYQTDDEKWLMEYQVSSDLEQNDGSYELNLEYKFNDTIQVYSNYNMFSGEKGTTFGHLKDIKSIMLGFKGTL